VANIFKKYWGRYNTAVIVYVILIIIFFGVSIAFPLFRSPRNLSNILVQIAPLAILSIGQAIALIGGGVDLTVGTVVSLTTVLAANFMGQGPFGVLATIIFIFVVAIAIGFINGFICNETKIPPLIVTLSTSTIIQGILLAYRMSPGGSVPKAISSFINYKLGIVTVSTIILAFLYILFITIMSRTSFGVHVYAIGGNPEFARMAGINVKRVRIVSYIISACLAAVAGFVISARIGTGIPNVGSPFLMDSLTAVIIGGASFAGGQGFVAGTLAGAIMVSIISNALNIASVSPFYQYIVKGAILLLAMIINSRKK
jgi:ribose/xylose/arabinose/galactoside ABC-type transport system permease subunit